MKLKYHPEASKDYSRITANMADYSLRRAERFEDNFHDTIRKILKRPRGGRPDIHDCRHWEIADSTYRIIYLELDEDIIVMRVESYEQRSGAWVDRLDDVF